MNTAESEDFWVCPGFFESLDANVVEFFHEVWIDLRVRHVIAAFFG